MKAIKYQGRVWIPATKAHTIESPYVLDADALISELAGAINVDNLKDAENKQQAEEIAELKILLQSASEDVVNGVYLIKKGEAENQRLKEFARSVIMQVCWNYNELDGGSVQDLAERLNLIEPHIATEADVDDYTDYDVGDTIYKFTATLALADMQKGE